MGEDSEKNLQVLQDLIQERTQDFESIYLLLEKTYECWMKDLAKHRHTNKLFQLLSNRQIMIMIILLTNSPTHQRHREHLYRRTISLDDSSNGRIDQAQFSVLLLTHYLAFFRIDDGGLSEDKVRRLYKQFEIEADSSTDSSLRQLSRFLEEVFQPAPTLFVKNSLVHESEQYLVVCNAEKQQRPIATDGFYWQSDQYCILLNLFRDRLPANYQILWGSIATEDDIELFFKRVRTFCGLVFVVMEFDTMHPRLRAIVLREQSLLARREQSHAPVYYFSDETTCASKYLRRFHVGPKYRDRHETLAHFTKLSQYHNMHLPDIQIICGTTGVGKDIVDQ